jgi:hypothetical protein
MARRGKPGVSRQSDAEQERRDQEVLRANKELAAYFKGRRTEREARAALKIIKAFVRDRERRDTKSRPPLPGADVAVTPKAITNAKAVSRSTGGGRHRQKPRRKSQSESSTSRPAASDAGDAEMTVQSSPVLEPTE